MRKPVSSLRRTIDPDGLGVAEQRHRDPRTSDRRRGLEAAAIASERATATQIKAIAKALATFSRAIATEDGTGGQGRLRFSFCHRDCDAEFAVLVSFLEFLGGVIIPRQRHPYLLDGDAGRSRGATSRTSKKSTRPFSMRSAPARRARRATPCAATSSTARNATGSWRTSRARRAFEFVVRQARLRAQAGIHTPRRLVSAPRRRSSSISKVRGYGSRLALAKALAGPDDDAYLNPNACGSAIENHASTVGDQHQHRRTSHSKTARFRA